MAEKIITKQELIGLIRAEKLRPEDLFEEEGLKELRLAAEAKGYAEGLASAAREAAKAPAPKAGGAAETPEDRYLDPATNPLIRPEA